MIIINQLYYEVKYILNIYIARSPIVIRIVLDSLYILLLLPFVVVSASIVIVVAVVLVNVCMCVHNLQYKLYI